MADVGDPWTATEGPYRVRLTPELPSPAARRILPDLSETARAATLGWAMARNPWWTSGDGRLDLDIAAGARVPLVGKIGAQGIFCLAIPHLRLGLAYDKAPVQDEYRTPRLPDNDRVWTAAGFEYKLGEKGAFDMGYAHLFVDDASSNLPNQDTPASPPKGKLIGSYAAKVDILSAQFRFSF